ncbi:MAG: hypothetical protein ACRDWX_09625 [Acidimicrobiia bacterium]
MIARPARRLLVATIVCAMVATACRSRGEGIDLSLPPDLAGSSTAPAVDDPQLILERINGAMSDTGSFALEGISEVRLDPGDDPVFSSSFVAMGQPDGAWWSWQWTSPTEAFPSTITSETREVGRVAYEQDPRSGRWSIDEDHHETVHTTDNLSYAADTGRLALEGMDAERDILAGEQVYRLAGSFPDQAGTERVVVWAAADDFLLRRLEAEGRVPASQFPGLVPAESPDLIRSLEVRYSRFGEPVTVEPPPQVPTALYRSAGFPWGFQIPSGWSPLSPSQLEELGVTAGFADEEMVLLIAETDARELGLETTTLARYVDSEVGIITSPERGFVLEEREQASTMDGLAVEELTLSRSDPGVWTRKLIYLHEDRLVLGLTLFGPVGRIGELEPLIRFVFNSVRAPSPTLVELPAA